jgi:E3 ubiquitin-protein ligase RNF216
MTHCNGDHIHFFCLHCANKYVEEEMGSGRCHPTCFGDTDCGGTFTRHQLKEFLSKRTFDRLEHLQQQDAVASAGLENLAECPFCDYKAEYPSVEEQPEFQCESPECHKRSCRLCLKESHTPMNCEEAKGDAKLNALHFVAEAQSGAVIHHCNKCKFAFVKDSGCNKITCHRCGNRQWYVDPYSKVFEKVLSFDSSYICSENIDNTYDHFRNSGCILHDNVEQYHDAQIRKAGDEAIAKIQAANVDVVCTYGPARIAVGFITIPKTAYANTRTDWSLPLSSLRRNSISMRLKASYETSRAGPKGSKLVSRLSFLLKLIP